MEGTQTKGNIIKVSFHQPVNNKTDYYFGSLKAIYNSFSPEEIGCNLQTLYFSHITHTNNKVTSKCVISKETVLRVSQKNRG